MDIFTPLRIGTLDLKNRIIRSGCFEGMCPDGKPSQKLIDHHSEVAKGSIAMTTVAYCAVSAEGRAYGNEMWMRREIIPQLRRLTEAVHNAGSKASIQLGHCGFFASKKVIGEKPLGPSRKFCTFRFSFSREMSREEMETVKQQFTQAALLSIESGFNAVELHAGHGYLLSQFLSPWTNKRADEYGGPLENRVRFPLEVIRSVKEALGDDYPVFVKMNIEDGFKGGLTADESVKFARALQEAGADALIPSCGFTSRTPLYMLRGEVPVKEFVRNEKNPFLKLGLLLFGKMMVQRYEFEENFLFEGAGRIKNAVEIPVGLIGGVCSIDNMKKAMEAGFDFVQIGRATIMDPDIVKKMQNGEVVRSECDHCNRCVGEMDSGRGVKCITREEQKASL